MGVWLGARTGLGGFVGWRWWGFVGFPPRHLLPLPPGTHHTPSCCAIAAVHWPTTTRTGATNPSHSIPHRTLPAPQPCCTTESGWRVLRSASRLGWSWVGWRDRRGGWVSGGGALTSHHGRVGGRGGDGRGVSGGRGGVVIG